MWFAVKDRCKGQACVAFLHPLQYEEPSEGLGAGEMDSEEEEELKGARPRKRHKGGSRFLDTEVCFDMPHLDLVVVVARTLCPSCAHSVCLSVQCPAPCLLHLALPRLWVPCSSRTPCLLRRGGGVGAGLLLTTQHHWGGGGGQKIGPDFLPGLRPITNFLWRLRCQSVWTKNFLQCLPRF